MKFFLFLFTTFLLHITVQAANFQTNPPFYGQKYADISNPRGLFIDDAGDILVVQIFDSLVTALYDTDNGDGSVRVNQVLIVNGTDLSLNHGITVHNGYLYASSATTVFRWPYVAGQRRLIEQPAEIIVHNIPISFSRHAARTLIFDSISRLYVSVGSDQNVDPNSNRARIRTFPLAALPNGGYDFQFGGVFADGLRNEVGLDFDAYGVLWGVENGADRLYREDLGGDIHNGNPAEELNKFNQTVGKHYGYPYCFSTHTLPGYPSGTQFAWPTFMNDGVHTDEWCNNPANNQPPILAMPAHWAPLGLQFLKNNMGCDSSEGSFPCSAMGDAFVASHGSVNSIIKVGYKVVQLTFDKMTGDPTGEMTDIIFEPNTQTCFLNCFRPVNAVFDKKGHLIVSTDQTNEIFRVYYNTPPPQINNQVL